MEKQCQPLEIACLGRPFHLGSLYDRRSDSLVPGITMWNQKTLDENLKSSPHESFRSEIIAEDDFSKMTSALDIDGSLKLSFLCGLVNVKGWSILDSQVAKFHWAKQGVSSPESMD